VRTARIVLILTGLTFGIWEAIDIFRIEVPAVAAVFAVLFLACTAWFWRRSSVPAATAFLPLFLVEVATAPTWQHVMVDTKVAAILLGSAGIASVLGVVAARVRERISRPIPT
jgi:hypothetical protein